jgi:membrane protease subunit (stomatin/prohibitin family)
MGQAMMDAVKKASTPGGEAAPASGATDAGAAAVGTETKFCLNCGKPIPKIAKFCPACGQAQQ